MKLEKTKYLEGKPVRIKSWEDGAFVLKVATGWWKSEGFHCMFRKIAEDKNLDIMNTYSLSNEYIDGFIDSHEWDDYDPPIRANKIQSLLAIGVGSPVPVKGGLFAVPNVSWGFFRWGEAAYLHISKGMMLTEVEIKVSYHDYKNDAKKTKFNNPGYFKRWKTQISKFYYAAPEKLAERIAEETAPEYGVISVFNNVFGYANIKVLKKAQTNSDAVPITQNDLLKLVRLASFRMFKDQ